MGLSARRRQVLIKRANYRLLLVLRKVVRSLGYFTWQPVCGFRENSVLGHLKPSYEMTRLNFQFGRLLKFCNKRHGFHVKFNMSSSFSNPIVVVVDKYFKIVLDHYFVDQSLAALGRSIQWTSF